MSPDRESWHEERTNPGTIERHPGAESAAMASVPPDGDLRAMVQQLQGGHAELRGVVKSMRADLSTLMRESSERERRQEDRHDQSLHGQRRSSWLTILLLALAQAAQLLLSHHGGHLP